MSRRSDSLSLKQARRIAIAAQGFDLAGHGEGRGSAVAEKRHLRRMIERLGVVQIDSVNVVARAHTLPGFSRLGPYATSDIDALAYSGRRRVLFEYWGHEASYLPVAIQPLFRFRMARAASGSGIYTGLSKFGRERRQLIDQVHREIERHGPMAASELSHDHKGEGGWWGWSEGKMAVEWLFWAGMVTTAMRRGAFERIYDVTERVLPQVVLDTPTPSDADANRELVRLSSIALGIATERCLRDYYRLEVADTKLAVADLVASGDLIPVAVEGFRNPAYLARDARIPRKVEARALLAPFDPLVWQRERTEGLFGARIRLEIYTPADKRVHGYYVLPFLLGDTLAARVDLKADRTGSVLVVQAAHLEDGAKAGNVAGPLAAELRLMARWLGLSDVRAEPRGDLAQALGEALRA
ncbi:MAG: YcaQ family DNA glycosylase [Phreatobacter sp.]|uniref:winged helix-turn-helix domain-containing protein n=1 Tax=Phreatobacter sp. TaxID=1966341 RepID=UPI001A5BFA79|nr:crosslink repair DNA glycosylase YcaQ family protein [Phreatobacter sp.]MBL8569101.1 YcaQ family DNA glycosylase [Phreatobacter sp.]